MLLPGGSVCIADLDAEPGLFHTPESAMSVHHHGFERSPLQQQLQAAGFTDITCTTAHVVQKPVNEGQLRDFPVFLMIGQRATSGR